MADARFTGLYMVVPVMGLIMLFVFIMQFIIRIWMVNSPKYVRKCVRFPLNEDLTQYIMSTMNKKGDTSKLGMYVKKGYTPRPPPPTYAGDEVDGQVKHKPQRFGAGGQYVSPSRGEYQPSNQHVDGPLQQHSW